MSKYGRGHTNNFCCDLGQGARITPLVSAHCDFVCRAVPHAGCCPCPCQQGPLLGCCSWCSLDTFSSAVGSLGYLVVFPAFPLPVQSCCVCVSEGPHVSVGSLADSGQTQPPGPVVPQKRLPDGFSSQIPLLWGGCLFQAVEQSKPRQSEGSDYEILATPAASSCCTLCF